ncbi:histone deacetylase 7 isoform X10 [Mustela erminea]|uniref:histone deacetylase 7 isoform X10 n=1 Tax=Mustela erminea TaxID=36723 RepID=UPI0013869EFE|nr:histone deacetylase 7 isoform X10 [Mustela erminea]
MQPTPPQGVPDCEVSLSTAPHPCSPIRTRRHLCPNGTQVSPGARCPSSPGTGRPRPRVDTPGFQPQPMDLRVGQRPAVEPPPEPALLALQHPQRLHHHLFFAGLQPRSAESMRLPMDTPVPQLQVGPQEQELRQLLNKDKSKRSAVASSVVKQKLAEVILKKQQAALERTVHSNSPSIPYRTLEPLETEGAARSMLSSFLPPVPSLPNDPPEHFPLRKTVSEPNLKLRYKPKKSLERRKNPLLRKESAPPSLRRRPTETLGDSSPSSSSTPASGCSSPNDSEHGPNPVLGSEALLGQRLRLQETSLAPFALPTVSLLPAITLGLPAPARADADRRTHPTLGPRGPVLGSPHAPLFLPHGLEHEAGGPLPSRLQPILLLDPSVSHTPLLTVPGLGPLPFHFAQSLLTTERLSGSGLHRPLSRTRSEPLPPSATAPPPLGPLQPRLERLKPHVQLIKRPAKPSEKPRLRQIPSAEDLETDGGGVGPVGDDGLEHRESSHGQHEARGPVPLQQHQQVFLWEQQRLAGRLPRGGTGDSVLLPLAQGSHRPLSRAQSSPAAPASLPTPEPASQARVLPSSETPSRSLPFTTGLVYDSVMLKHQCSCGDNSRHPEHAGRIQSIWSRLQERGLRSQCECLRGRKASLEELQSVHSERHVLLYGTNPLSRLKLDNGKLAGLLAQRMFVMLPCGGVGVSVPGGLERPLPWALGAPPFCSPRPSPYLLVLGVLPDLLGQGLSHNAPLPARSSLWPASCDSLCLPRLSWSASPSPSPHHAPRPLPSLEAQGLGLGGLPAWARGPEWKTVVQTAPRAPTVPQGLSRVSWGLKPPPGPNPKSRPGGYRYHLERAAFLQRSPLGRW